MLKINLMITSCCEGQLFGRWWKSPPGPEKKQILRKHSAELFFYPAEEKQMLRKHLVVVTFFSISWKEIFWKTIFLLQFFLSPEKKLLREQSAVTFYLWKDFFLSRKHFAVTFLYPPLHHRGALELQWRWYPFS